MENFLLLIVVIITFLSGCAIMRYIDMKLKKLKRKKNEQHYGSKIY